MALLAAASLALWSLWTRYDSARRPLDAGYWRRVAGYLALALALLYTHYTAIFALGAHAVFLLLHAGPHVSRRQVAILAHLGLGLVLGYVPWLVALAGRDVRAATAFAAHVPPSRALDVYTQFFVYGQQLPPVGGLRYHLLVAAIVALALLSLLAVVRRRHNAWRATLLIAAMTIVPMLTLVASVYAVQGKLSGRHGWPAWIGAALALGTAAAWLRGPRLARGLVIAAAGLVLLASSRLELQPIYNSYLREAFAYVAEHAQPGDVLVLRDGSLFTAADYYRAAVPSGGCRRPSRSTSTASCSSTRRSPA